MAFNKDYLLNQVNQLAEALAKILQLKKDLTKQELETVMDIALTDHIGTDFEEILEQGDVDLMPFLVNEKNLSLDQIEFVARLLKEKGIAQDDKAIANNFYTKSLIVMKWLAHQSDATLAFDHFEVMDDLENRIHNSFA